MKIYYDVRLVLTDDCEPDGPLPIREIKNALEMIPFPAGIETRIQKLKQQTRKPPPPKKGGA